MKLYVVLFVAFIFSTYILAAQTPKAEPMDASSLAALHSLAETDSPPFLLYSILAQSGALNRLLQAASAIDRPPDAVLFFDGTRQHQEYCIADPKTNLEITEIRQGAVLCTIVLDDNADERYRLDAQYRHTPNGEWHTAERVTSLFAAADRRRFIPLVFEPQPNIPYYVASVEFYRVESPCEIRIVVAALPGMSLPRKYFGIGVGGGFIVQEKANLQFREDTVAVFQSIASEFSGNGLLGINLFPGRDPFRTYSAAFWKSTFYRDFFSRWSLQAGLAFTRSNQLLEHYSLGVGLRLFGFLDIVGSMLFTSRPKENTASIISPIDHSRAEQLTAQKRVSYFMLGANINILEW